MSTSWPLKTNPMWPCLSGQIADVHDSLPRANRELRESLERIQPDVVHASLTLSPLDFGLPELCQQLQVPLVATFHPL